MAFPEDVGDTGSIPKSGRSPGEGNGCPLQYSAQFSRSVVSDSLRPHEPQHAGPPCPSPTPGVHPDARPLSQLLESNGGNINNSSSQWRPPPRETAEALSGSSLFSCPGFTPSTVPCAKQVLKASSKNSWVSLKLDYSKFYFLRVGKNIIKVLKSEILSLFFYVCGILKDHLGGFYCWLKCGYVFCSLDFPLYWQKMEHFTLNSKR